MAQLFHFLPAFTTSPFMRMFRIHGTRGKQISIRFLCGSYNHQHTVNVLFQLLIRISLKQIAGSFNSLVHIRIIKRIACHLIIFTRMSSHFKVFVASGFLTFTKSQWNSYFTTGFQTLSPERIRQFNRSKRNRINRIAVCRSLLLRVCPTSYQGKKQSRNHKFFHGVTHIYRLLFSFIFQEEILPQSYKLYRYHFFHYG